MFIYVCPKCKKGFNDTTNPAQESIACTVAGRHIRMPCPHCHVPISIYEAGHYEEFKRREAEERVEDERREAERRVEDERQEAERRAEAEEERRKPIIDERKRSNKCYRCGRPLGFFDKLFGRTQHPMCNEQNVEFYPIHQDA